MDRQEIDVVVVDLSDEASLVKLEGGIDPDPNRMTFFSDEWIQKKEQCEAFVSARSGKFEKRVGARECAVREVDKREATAFLGRYHLQGGSHLSIVSFGLYDGNELVGVMSLGRHPRKIAHNWVVLDRLCFRAGIQVVGGTSRLFEKCKEWADGQKYDAIVSYSDNRLTPGGVYQKLGFEKKWTYRPDYFYVREGKRVSKQSQRKCRTGCPEEITEYEWASRSGLRRVHDAGKICWVYHINPEVEIAARQKNSETTAKLHAQGVFKNAHMRGYFQSKKNGGEVYFGSSYELRCMFELEDNVEVKSYKRCEAFKAPNGNWRNPDLWIEFVDGHSEIWEVKPCEFTEKTEVLAQLKDTMAYAFERGVSTRVWTEKNSSLGCDRKITAWARKYMAEHQGDDSWVNKKVEQCKQTHARFYQRHIANDKVEVWCEYCKTMHTALRFTYDQNIKRNGTYICERYGGHLAGKKRKGLKKTNPYLAEGKKQCSTCSEILPLEQFAKRVISWDGKAPLCKKCAKAWQDANYDKRRVHPERRLIYTRGPKQESQDAPKVEQQLELVPASKSA